MKRRTFVVSPEEQGEPLARFLSRGLAQQEGEAEALIHIGAVYVAGRRCQDPRAPLSAGEAVSVVLAEGGQSVLAPRAALPAPKVLFEDAWLVALDKPAGMTTQPTPGRSGDSLWDWALENFGPQTGLVHRLDRETSGVVVFGRSADAVSRLTAQFRTRQSHKEYLAVVTPGVPARGTVELPLSRDPSRPGRFRASAHANGLSARTDYERRFATAAWDGVALFPHTGRTHQLRAHLAGIGHPIVGDVRYGGPRRVGEREAGRCLLHARRLVVAHPVRGDALTLEAPLPSDLAPLWLGPA